MDHIRTIVSLSTLIKAKVLILLCLLSACAYFPPKPAECRGPYRQVNATERNDSSLQESQDVSAINTEGTLDKTQHIEEGTVDGK